MAFLLLAGLDNHGNDATDFDRYDTAGALSWASTGGKYGGGRLSLDPGTANLKRVLITSASESGSGWCAAHWKRRLDPNVNAEFLLIQHPSAIHFWIEIGNSQRKAGVTSDDKIILLNNDDTLLGESINTFTGAPGGGTWRHLDMQWTLGQGDGTFKLWVNDVLEINVTGLTIGSAAQLNDWRIWRSEGPQGFLSGGDSFLLDDLVFQDGNGFALLDGHRIWQALPGSDTTQNWTRSAGADNFALVDDPDPDADATYLDSVNGRDVYGWTAPTITGTIQTVVVKCLVRRPSGAETLKLGMILGGDELLSSAITPASTTLWGEEWFTLTAKPGGGIWTQADLDSSEIILEATGTGIRVTQVWVEILTTALVIPTKPTLTVGTIRADDVDLSSSAFVAGEGGTHQASQWQVTLATDGGFAAPVFDSGTDTTNLLSITATGLSTGVDYIARVRHQEDNNLWSDYSSSVAFTTVGVQAPTLTISSSGPDFIALSGNAFVSDAGTHASTDWQLTLLTDPTFASPILDDSDRITAELLAWTEFNLDLFANQYIARVRYHSSGGAVSEWSNTVTSSIIVTGQFYTPFGERAIGFVLRSANWDEVWADLESTWTNTTDPDAICLVVSRRLPNTPTPGEVDPIFWQGMPSVDKQIIWTRVKFDQVGLGAVSCVGDSSPNGIICRTTEGLENFEDFSDPALTGWRVVKEGLGSWEHKPLRGASLAGDGSEDITSDALGFNLIIPDPFGPNALIVWDAAGSIAQGKWIQIRSKIADRAAPGFWWNSGWPAIAMGIQDDDNYYSFQNAHQCGLFATWTFQTTYKHGPLSTDFVPQAMFRDPGIVVGSTLSYHIGASSYEYMKAALTDEAPHGQIEESYLAFANRRGFDAMQRFSVEGSWTSGKVGLVVNACTNHDVDALILFDHVAITTNNFVKFTGLPDGWRIEIEAGSITEPFWFGNDQVPRRWPVGDAAVADKTISFEGHAMPYDTLKLYDPDDNLIETWDVGDNALGEPGVWGGDVYNISVGGGGIGAIGGPSARNTGTPGGTTGSGYYAYLSGGTELRLDRGDDVGGLVNLGTFAFEYEPKIFYNIVLEATGTTIRAKVWSGAESDDPGTWGIEVTDATYASGAPGLVGLDGTTVDFDVFAAGIGGDAYPTGRFPGTPVWISPTVPFSVDATRIIALEWTRPSMTDGVIGGDVTYELQYRRNNGEAWTDLGTTIDPVRTFLWDTTRLQANADYCVRVRTLVACEKGPYAEICSITISEEAEEPCPEDNPEEGAPTITGSCDGGAQVTPTSCDDGAPDAHADIGPVAVPQDFQEECLAGAQVTYTGCDGGVEPDSICPEV